MKLNKNIIISVEIVDTCDKCYIDIDTTKKKRNENKKFRNAETMK